MASVHDVAAYILETCGDMTTMKLQKLCYYSQGWSLAWDGEPLYRESIEAWANGPVTVDLYRAHRGKFRVSASDLEQGNSSILSDNEKETIDAVLDAYAHLSGQQLSNKTHSERPWLEARGTLADGERSSTIVDLESMQDFFGGLASSAS
ncbi:type II toxin-antitoxin system antitoxin SocA domain-containing protein [Glutamicibacter sp. PS]|uniref:Panacea domain-containing protein n=1 Tax=Glutamicibacter sp. PS TaxID=3075634 RepID=UPI0028463CDE|nr:type II toxin-antitoxin system antitoxin SocA domain-containing protein [Glutamicibacter sp. PS]MDR4533196.1 DUF4065 domain-containing protein [Glutamicibacter sp. PS]